MSYGTQNYVSPRQFQSFPPQIIFAIANFKRFTQKSSNFQPFFRETFSTKQESNIGLTFVGSHAARI